MDSIQVVGGTLYTHGAEECEGRPCCVHSPSDHPLRNHPLNWRSDIGIMERICDHGIGHDDPDDVAYRNSIGMEEHLHGCDGCCRGEKYE